MLDMRFFYISLISVLLLFSIGRWGYRVRATDALVIHSIFGRTLLVEGIDSRFDEIPKSHNGPRVLPRLIAM